MEKFRKGNLALRRRLGVERNVFLPCTHDVNDTISQSGINIRRKILDGLGNVRFVIEVDHDVLHDVLARDVRSIAYQIAHVADQGPVITPKKFGLIDCYFHLPHGYKDAEGKDLLHGLKK